VGGLIAAISPTWALRRAEARARLERLYKAAQPSNARKAATDWRSGDGVMDHARAKLRMYARNLDQNHDLTTSILNLLSYQASAVTFEPRVMSRSGAPAERVNDELRMLWMRHRDELDGTLRLPWCELSAIIARTWFRDGEVFVQHLLATAVRSNGVLPYMVQAHEPDLVPYDYIQKDRPRIIHGIEVDQLGRPTAYHLYKEHPGDTVTQAQSYQTDTIRIGVDSMTHLALRPRLGQKRGSSILSPAITRLADVLDYEESERLAAKVSSAMCAAITRAADFATPAGAVDAVTGERPMELQPGMILDNLMPGEKVELLNTNRPNPELSNFRKAMLRAACSGIGVSYSSATADYDGTYSSQRQELVEIRSRYDAIREHYQAQFLRPMWRRFVQAVQIAGLFSPRGADLETLYDLDFIAPATPWIDPSKEATADKTSIEAGIESRHGVIRKRGGDPRRVDDERDADEPEEPIAEPEEPAPALEVVANG